ncbi:MAG: hypothetical protein ABSH45_02185 [Bryobacteraceae bacterium]
MKRAWLALTWLVLCGLGGAAWAADLNSVHAVYLLNMGHGLDQYLANRLTGEHLFVVVTDPKKADAVITDHLGEDLDATLEIIAPGPKPPQDAEAKAKEPAETKSKSKGDAAAAAGSSLAAAFGGDTNNKLEHPVSGFSRSKGTVFLVDAKSRQLVWSLYIKPKGTESKDLDRTASDIVSRLKKDAYPKAPKATPAK